MRTNEYKSDQADPYWQEAGVYPIPMDARIAVRDLPDVHVVSLSSTGALDGISGLGDYEPDKPDQLPARAEAELNLRVASAIAEIAERHQLPFVRLRGIAVALEDDPSSYRRSLLEILYNGGLEYRDEDKNNRGVTDTTIMGTGPGNASHLSFSFSTWSWAQRHTRSARRKGEHGVWPGIIVYNPAFLEPALNGYRVTSTTDAIIGLVLFDHMPYVQGQPLDLTVS